MTARSASDGGAPTLWRNRSFVLLLGGESVSSLLAAVTHVAIAATAVDFLSASEKQVGFLGAAEQAAFLLLGLPAGVWVDRMSLRRVMIAANLVRAALLAVIPVAWGLGWLTMTWVTILALGLGTCRLFFDVAYMSIVPALVAPERLTDANSKLTGTFEVAGIAGPSIGGQLMKIISAPVLPLAATIGSLVSAFAIWRIPEPRADARPPRRDLTAEMGEGVRFVAGHPLISRVVASAMVSNFFGTLSFTMFPFLILEYWDLSPSVFGLIMTASGIGGVVGAVVGPPLVRMLGEGHAIPVTALVMGVLGAAFPVSLMVPRSAGPWVLAIGGFFVYGWVVAFNIAQVSLRQRVCPPRLLGRMNATIRFAVWGVFPIGALASGFMASSLGLLTTFWVGTIGEILSVGILVFSPLWRLKRVDSYDPASAVEGVVEASPPAI